MAIAKLDQYSFHYDSDEMFCFEDETNKRIAFTQESEIQLIIDINNGKLTFHPDKSVNIYEINDNTYKIKSFF